MKKIAFCGPMRAGKDTAALCLRDWHHLKFAGPLYQILRYAQGIAGIPGGKDRTFLQFVGQWGRDHGAWTRVAEKEIKALGDTVPGIVVTDGRHEDEFEMLRAQGFILVLVKRNRWARWESERGHRPDWIDKIRCILEPPHPSEVDWIGYDFDYTITNDGSIEDLHKKVLAIALHEN